ncbi:trypsin-like serine protease [Streptomyces sp. NPDC047967]|uniref:trypsin-like serine protease n=1 Tax=Streptomyces sp. NPDC047967 TaxID=3154924 RepID=UPI00340C3065
MREPRPRSTAGAAPAVDLAISTTLRSAPLPIVPDADCRNSYGSYFVASHMVCAGRTGASDAETLGACNGDSGGPLVIGGRLAGIVSWGIEDCVGEGAYSVFAKVTTYVPDINARAYDTNMTWDHRADLMARRASNNTMYQFESTGTAMSKSTYSPDGGGIDVLLQTDLNRDDNQDLLVRGKDGNLYWHRQVRQRHLQLPQAAGHRSEQLQPLRLTRAGPETLATPVPSPAPFATRLYRARNPR